MQCEERYFKRHCAKVYILNFKGIINGTFILHFQCILGS